MVNFEIRLIDRDTSIREGRVYLGFSSTVRQKLTIKDVQFYPNSTEPKITTIDTVMLGEREIIRTFTFGNKEAEYDRLEFLLKQEGKKGWIVFVDLKSDAPIIIEESPFQVI